MQALSRIVWSEGMHLAQHHFQAQTAYFERVAGAALGDLFLAPYGLLSCELEADALRNGTVVMLAARGIMPDGLPFSFPDEPVPAALAIADSFSPTASTHLLLLAVPPEVPGRGNCDVAASGTRDDVRYSVAERELVDETTGADVRTVQLARKNFRLLLDNDPADGLISLPIARIRRDGAGHFVYDAGWVGPCLRITASRRLRELVVRLIEMLEERATVMLSERALAAGTAEYAPREIAGFWFLHALNSAIPTLRHWQRTGAAHPEQLYLLLAQLAGALCTFSLHSHPRELPAYDHDDLDRCFTALERHLRAHLDVILPADAVSLEVRPTEPGFYTAAVPDSRCFARGAHWYLGVRSTLPASEVIARTARIVKLCSARFIARLVREAYPGLAIEHLASPPPEVSPRLGTQYFAISRTDPCWKSIVETREVGLYVPAAIPDAELELRVALERRD